MNTNKYDVGPRVMLRPPQNPETSQNERPAAVAAPDEELSLVPVFVCYFLALLSAIGGAYTLAGENLMHTIALFSGAFSLAIIGRALDALISIQGSLLCLRKRK